MREGDDWYAILQVHESAEPEIIQAAYKRLVRKYHPDINSSPNAKERMQRLNEAYAVLGDPRTRARYDQQRSRERVEPEGSKATQQRQGRRQPPSERSQPSDLQQDTGSRNPQRNTNPLLFLVLLFSVPLILMFAESVIRVVPLDVRATLRATDIKTGWLNVGLDDLGRNKLVPVIQFRLENVSDQRLRALQLNGVFRRCMVLYAGQPEPEEPVSPADEEAGTCLGEDQEWGSALVRAVGREGFVAGASLGPFTMESSLGYTGEQSLAEMFQHSDFVDVKIELFFKHREEPWVKLEEFQVDRELVRRIETRLGPQIVR